MDNNDFTATAGITLKQWKKDVATMVVDELKISQAAERADERKAASAEKAAARESKAAEKAAAAEKKALKEKAAEIDKADKEQAKTVSTAFKFLALASGAAIGSAAIAGLNQLNTQVGEVTDGFIAMGESGRTGIEQIGLSIRRSLLDKVTVGLTAVNEKNLTDEIKINRELESRSETYDSIAEKIRRLSKMESTESAKTGPNQDASKSELAISAAILENQDKLIASALEQYELLDDTTSGSQKRLEQYRAEVELAQKKAEIDARAAAAAKATENPHSKDALLRTAAIEKGIADSEFERETKSRRFGQLQTANQAVINELISKTGISLSEQNTLYSKRINLSENELKYAQETFGVESDQAALAAASLQTLKLANTERLHAQKIEIQAAENRVTNLEFDLSGNKLLAELEKNKLNYAMQIAEAQRTKNAGLEVQLRREQDLSNVKAKVAYELKTPQQRHDERADQDKQNQAERLVLRRMLSGKEPQWADGRNHVSPATERLRKQLLARHQLAPAGPKGPAMNVGTLTILGETKMGIATVSAIKHG